MHTNIVMHYITCLASRDCSFRFVCTKVHCALNEVQRHVVEDTNCMLNSSNFISSMSRTPFYHNRRSEENITRSLLRLEQANCSKSGTSFMNLLQTNLGLNGCEYMKVIYLNCG